MTTTNSKPIAILRDGSLKASIWKNTGEKGDFLSVRISRTWRDAQGTYHDTDSFSGSELLRVAHLATQAYDQALALRPSQGGQEPTEEPA